MTNFDVESKKYDVLGDNSPEHRILLIIEKLRPYVQSHGGNVEFDHLVDSVVFIRFSGTCVTCPLSFYTVTYGIERHIKAELPWVTRVEVIEKE